ncbi:hypothetical protein LCGC14_2374890 [marine sediment metagenome]|uniref:Membrane transporter protein n=1 Tax=marine sediment metagenome TaxID=412755 RepID=A0A0F9C2R1_9ZZZZ
MEVMEILGYTGALFIGLVLGLIGGGGSILTVPILVYVLAFNPVIATAYSLFVVGTTALVGAVKNTIKGKVEFKTAIIFAVPAFITVYLTRALLIPAIPHEIFKLDGFIVTKNLVIMLFFASIMLLASIRMIRDQKIKAKTTAYSQPTTLYLVLYAIIIGMVTGIVGAGGGFLIVPALVIFAKISMKKAVATSLFIIAVNSLIGLDTLTLLKASRAAVSAKTLYIGQQNNRTIHFKLLPISILESKWRY